MCKFLFWQFWGSSQLVFQPVITKLQIEDKLHNVDFILSGMIDFLVFQKDNSYSIL